MSQDEFSPFAVFHFKLRGFVIKDLFGKEIPKYIAWNRIGSKRNKEYYLLISNNHPEMALTRKI